MTRKTQALAQEIAVLPIKERAELAYLILEQLETGRRDDEAEVERAWVQEIHKRRQDLRSGKAKLIDGEEALRSVRNRKR
jgi:hypothetical protein